MNEIRRRLADRLADVDAIRWVAMGLMIAFGGFITLFVSGYAVADPGGWLGIGGPVVWVLFMVGLGVLALYRPGETLGALAVAACAPLAFGLWSLLDYEAAGSWEDSHGPISLILVVAVCAPAAVAGLFRPREAGYLMLVVTVVPILLEAMGAGSEFLRPVSIGLITVPIVASGVLFLVAAYRLTHPHHRVALPGALAPR